MMAASVMCKKSYSNSYNTVIPCYVFIAIMLCVNHTAFPNEGRSCLPRRHKNKRMLYEDTLRKGQRRPRPQRKSHSPWGPARPARRAAQRFRARPCHPFGPSAPANPCHPCPRGDLGTLGSRALRACPSRRWGQAVRSRREAPRSPAENNVDIG